MHKESENKKYEDQFLINQMLKEKIKFFLKWPENNQSQLVLTFETYNFCLEPETNLIESKP